MNQQNWPQSRRPLILISLNLKGTPAKCEVIWVQKSLNLNNEEESRKTCRKFTGPCTLMYWHFYIITLQ